MGAAAVEEVAPKMPPPNPIEVMSKEQRQRQKENTMILDVFQQFDDSMAQFDEDIENRQNFAENIVSVVQELAGNNKVLSGAKYSAQIEAKCNLVVEAAKQYADALQQFNAMMEGLYSQMEDEMEDDVHSKHTLVTAGGGLSVDPFHSGSPAQDVPSGLPANTLNYKYSHGDHHGHGDKSKQQDAKDEGANEKMVAASIGPIAALPRYRSAQDLAKANEPERKVAKALFDYPGGYRGNELTFHRGTSLIITKEKEGWVYGHYELEPSLTGWFPKSYVKIITGTT